MVVENSEQSNIVNSLPQSAQAEIQKVLENSLIEQKKENDLLRAKMKSIEDKEARFAEIESNYTAKCKKLEDELKKSESIIDSFAELQIDTRRLNPIEEIAKANGIAPDYLKLTLEKNPDEFLRIIVNKRNILMEESILRLQDKELDPTGGKIIENMQRAIMFFYERKTMPDFDTEAIKKYPEFRQILIESFNQFVAWRKEEADVVNISIKTCDGAVWYALKEFKEKVEKKRKAVAVNPEEEIAKLAKHEDIENDKLSLKIDETNKKVDETNKKFDSVFEKMTKWFNSNQTTKPTDEITGEQNDNNEEDLTVKIKPKLKK